MGETIIHDELAREVADRLNADPALVSMRIAASEKGAGERGAGGEVELGADGGERRRGAAPTLSAQEQRERALLAMCVAAPAEGGGFGAADPGAHVDAAMARTREWLGRHLDAPLSGLPRDDDDLVSMVTQMVMRAEREPVSRGAMEINFLELERKVIERRIEAAARAGGDAPVELQRQRAELSERIARREAAGVGGRCRDSGPRG